MNVLARAGLSMDEIVHAGAQRVSVGGALAWAAVAATVAAAERMRDTGDFSFPRAPAQIEDWLA